MKSEKDSATTEDTEFESLEGGEESSSLVADESVEDLAEKELDNSTPADTEMALRRVMSDEGDTEESAEEEVEDEEAAEHLSDVAPRQKNEAVCANCFCIVPKLSIDKATKLCQSCNY